MRLNLYFAAMSLCPAVFLDRDGTLNVQVVRDGKPYPPDTLADFRLYDGVVEDCARVKASDFVLVVATNQPDVGRGKQAQTVVEAIHAHLQQLVPSLDLHPSLLPRRRRPRPALRLP